MSKRLQALVAVLAVDLSVLAGTGAWLALRYQPTRSGALPIPQLVHRWASWIALGLVVAVVVLAVLERAGAVGVVGAMGAATAVALIAGLGPRLAWRRVRLSSLPPGHQVRAGLFVAWDRYAIGVFDRRGLGTVAAFKASAAAHVLGLPLALVVTAAVVAATRRRPRPAPDPPAPSTTRKEPPRRGPG